jgi:hypothetical protein
MKVLGRLRTLGPLIKCRSDLDLRCVPLSHLRLRTLVPSSCIVINYASSPPWKTGA